MNDIDDQAEEVRLGKGAKSGGAGVLIQDSRFSSVINWVWIGMGSIAISLLGIAANNLYQLNITVARGLDADAARDIRLSDHELRIRQVEKDLNTVEGRVFRGVDGYDVSEPKHGN